MPEPQNPISSRLSDIFAGAGLGLLLGVVVGLSASPVVGMVVGALTSVLAVFLGLSGEGSETSRLPRVNGLRIGAFGLAGLGVGLHVRVNNSLAQAPSQQLSRWQAAFPDDPLLVKQMVIFERTGLAPTSLALGPDGAAVAVEAQKTLVAIKSSVLFSTLSDFDVCTRLNPDRYADVQGLLAVYKRPSSPQMLAAVAQKIEALPPDDWVAATTAAHVVLCQVQREGGE